MEHANLLVCQVGIPKTITKLYIVGPHTLVAWVYLDTRALFNWLG